MRDPENWHRSVVSKNECWRVRHSKPTAYALSLTTAAARMDCTGSGLRYVCGPKCLCHRSSRYNARNGSGIRCDVLFQGVAIVRKIKRVSLALAAISGVVLSSGCATNPYRAYPGPSSNHSVLISGINRFGERTSITCIDGKDTSSFIGYNNGDRGFERYPASVEVLPGHHDLIVNNSWNRGLLFSNTMLSLDAEAGHSYTLEGSMTFNGATTLSGSKSGTSTTWLEDETGKHVGAWDPSGPGFPNPSWKGFLNPGCLIPTDMTL